MGGKGGSTTTVQQPKVDNNAAAEATAGYLASMMQMNGMMNQQMMRQQNQQLLNSVPKVQKAPEMDYSEEQNKLANKAKATYGLDQAKKVGRMATLNSSPLLDEDTPTTTKSVLAGK